MKKVKQNKYTLRMMSKTWRKVYGESLRLQYSGFYNKLKKQK